MCANATCASIICAATYIGSGRYLGLGIRPAFLDYGRRCCCALENTNEPAGKHESNAANCV